MSTTSSLFIDEPLIVPFTAAETIVRLSQLLAHLDGEISRQIEPLRAARNELLSAVETGDQAAIKSTLYASQQQLVALYEAVKTDEAQCVALGFPTPAFLADAYSIAPVNVESVTATFTLTGKQILTTLSFERAANARWYWLHEVSHFQDKPDERVEEAVIQNSAPLFDRLRLPSGPRVLRIKARNLSTSVLSDEFTIHVPYLNEK